VRDIGDFRTGKRREIRRREIRRREISGKRSLERVVSCGSEETWL